MICPNSLTDGSSCLHQAAYSGTVEMVALLLSLGADGLKKVSAGHQCIIHCYSYTCMQCIDVLHNRRTMKEGHLFTGALTAQTLSALRYCWIK